MLSSPGDNPMPYLRISEINVKAKRRSFVARSADAPEDLKDTLPSKIGEREEDHVRAAPAVSHVMRIKKCAHEHTSSAVLRVGAKQSRRNTPEPVIRPTVASQGAVKPLTPFPGELAFVSTDFDWFVL